MAEQAVEKSATAQDQTPAVAKIVEFAKASGRKTLAYFELNNEPDGKQVASLTILCQNAGYTGLIIYNAETTKDFIQPLATEAIASGKDGWRTIAITVDKDAVAVERGPNPGPLSGIDARLHAEADRAFPGHS